MGKSSVDSFTIIKAFDNKYAETNDLVAVEEPLEILVEHGSRDRRKTENLAITMRTPGNDLELVTGFLAAEGIVKEYAEIEWIGHRLGQNQENSGNTVKVKLHPQAHFDQHLNLRHFYINSSCGVCGKASLDSVVPVGRRDTSESRFTFSPELIKSLPDKLREHQLVFNHTGGLHAACLFDQSAKALLGREDVGRHNALDKVLGATFALNQWPLSQHLLLLSGRVSFELVQKAVRAGISFIASIGAPSSLAVELAKKADLTLIGFVSTHRFNIYHGSSRVKDGINIGSE